jgi:hypothetical protein
VQVAGNTWGEMLDFYHASQHLWAVAEAIWPDEKPPKRCGPTRFCPDSATKAVRFWTTYGTRCRRVHGGYRDPSRQGAGLLGVPCRPPRRSPRSGDGIASGIRHGRKRLPDGAQTTRKRERDAME